MFEELLKTLGGDFKGLKVYKEGEYMTSDQEVMKLCFAVMEKYEKNSRRDIEAMVEDLNYSLRGISDRDLKCLVYIDKRTHMPKLDVFDKVERKKYIEDKLLELRKDAGKNMEEIHELERYKELMNK